MTAHTDLEQLQVLGAFTESVPLWVGRVAVGTYARTEDNRHHVFDANDRRLGDFATAENANSFIRRHWRCKYEELLR